MSHRTYPPNRQLSQFIMDQFPPDYVGWAVDVGASDGISVNTTFAMEETRRWTVLSVEANPDFGRALKSCRAFVHMCAVGAEEGSGTFHVNDTNLESFSSLKPTSRTDVDGISSARFRAIEVPIWTLDGLLALWQFPRLDVLCIDTEGTELDVLKGCDLARWQPRVIVTECWDAVGPIDLYLEGFGYVKSARNVHNDIFIHGGKK